MRPHQTQTSADRQYSHLKFTPVAFSRKIMSLSRNSAEGAVALAAQTLKWRIGWKDHTISSLPGIHGFFTEKKYAYERVQLKSLKSSFELEECNYPRIWSPSLSNRRAPSKNKQKTDSVAIPKYMDACMFFRSAYTRPLQLNPNQTSNPAKTSHFTRRVLLVEGLLHWLVWWWELAWRGHPSAFAEFGYILDDCPSHDIWNSLLDMLYFKNGRFNIHLMFQISS